ncbi:Methyltransferase type 11 [Metarhizium album ARSEF 1941]|uniref:Methyltransferase type 11 n=1 Tax=Metarhizium album (strain ARSEF 1941) TaxID=1081103 RepID=A0A0B2X6W7_METAS|nr:Methyltransferase type 11 [Metarhizium album ARSEF 1941]KHO01513.1 Methyltransferase type 11 [Metarhizium album ARSEF 1941]
MVDQEAINIMSSPKTLDKPKQSPSPSPSPSQSPSQSPSPSPKPPPSPLDDSAPAAPIDEYSTNTQIPFRWTDDDADSALGDEASVLSSTVSLSESIFNYRSLHGRTYQNSNTTEYWGPNDDEQNLGLDIAHQFITMLLNDRLFEAPIPERPAKILDVGTGTGIWAIDMADAYPSCEIIGTDISPIQPLWVPQNLSFEIEDAQLDWTFGPATFDFIHMRALYGSISDWRRLYRQAYTALKPGGWLENFEFTINLRSDLPEIRDDPDHIFKRWSTVFMEASDRMGKSLRIGMNGRMTRYMREAGFEHIAHKHYQVPVGAWSTDYTYKQIGLYNLTFMENSLEGFALYLLREVMGWEYARVQVFLAEMRSALRNAKNRPYYLV